MPEGFEWLNHTLFRFAGQEITRWEVFAFALWLAGGLLLTFLLQSARFLQMLVRTGLDNRFVSLVTALRGRLRARVGPAEAPGSFLS